MKRFKEAIGWVVFLLLAGVFLLLKNLHVFGRWGDLIWGALFAAAGLGFLVWFVLDLPRWWRAIPAFTLLGSGAMLVLQSQGVQLQEWSTALFLFGMALGFWAVLLVRSEHWWAVIPGGVLTVLGILLGFWSQLSEPGRLAVLFVGVGLVFVLLYVIRFGQHDTRWASVPAGALLLLGLVTLMQALKLPSVVADWWPVLLAVGGLGLLIGTVGLRGTAPGGTPTVPAPDFEKLPPAPGASVTDVLPEVIEPTQPTPPVAPTPSPARETQPADIYDLIRQQPSGQPPAPADKS